MKINLDKFKRQNGDKLDAVGTGISIEKKHRDFLEKFNINLSALVREFLDKLILESETNEDKKDEK